MIREPRATATRQPMQIHPDSYPVRDPDHRNYSKRFDRDSENTTGTRPPVH